MASLMPAREANHGPFQPKIRKSNGKPQAPDSRAKSTSKIGRWLTIIMSNSLDDSPSRIQAPREPSSDSTGLRLGDPPAEISYPRPERGGHCSGVDAISFFVFEDLCLFLWLFLVANMDDGGE